MKVQHLDTYELSGYPKLCELLCIDPSLEDERTGLNSIENQLSDSWYDCDYVKLDGELGRGDHCFIDCKLDDTRYIIHLSESEPEAIALIDWWLAGAHGDLIDNVTLHNTWDDWDKVQKGVAYRGGSGYCYCLYAKELGDFA